MQLSKNKITGPAFTQAPQSHAYSLRRFLHKDILCISIIDPDIFSFFCIISKDSSANARCLTTGAEYVSKSSKKSDVES